MLTHAHAMAAPSRVPHSPPTSQPGTDLLAPLGPIEDEWHILLIGDGPVDVMCALLRAGAPRVTHLRSPERLEAESASLAVVPRLQSLGWLEAALSPIRRALIANGRLAVCVDPLPMTEKRVGRMLKLHGFSKICADRVAGRLLLTAEVPTFGLRRCA